MSVVRDQSDAQVVVVGSGLSGLVTATELAARGIRVLVLDQESRANLGGQAHWSFGGLMLIDSPEQRRLGVHDSLDLATSDWLGSAAFDRPEDHWGRQWAHAYLQFAAGEKRSWLRSLGMSWFPIVGWAERGDGTAGGHGNSVPRFHVTWGTGPGVVEPFLRAALDAEQAGRLRFAFRHRVDGLTVSGGAVTGLHGSVLAPTTAARGRAGTREVIGQFEVAADAVVIASGGIGGNHELVRAAWPERLGAAPTRMITGVPAYVDGRMLGFATEAGASLVNRDRMWHYVEGIHNWDPVWPEHAIRILAGPSSMWVDATGRRLPPPLFPGYDTLGTLAHLRSTGYDHSWFITNTAIAGKEFTLSGSEQNPDLTDRDLRAVARRPVTAVYPSVQAFLDRGIDFVQADAVAELVRAMNTLTGSSPAIDADLLAEQITERDRQVHNRFSKDAQLAAMAVARAYRGDRLSKRAFPPVALTDPKHGPLLAVRLSVLTRKTLGGLETDLSGRVLVPAAPESAGRGEPLPGLYAVGEAAGFGGGGLHGYRALEGSFLGGCLFTGRTVGRSI